MKKYMNNFQRNETVETVCIIQKYLTRMVHVFIPIFILSCLTSCIKDTTMYDQDELNRAIQYSENNQQDQSAVKAAEPDPENLATFSVEVDNSYNKVSHPIVF